MLTETDILALIANGEGASTEFKEQVDRNRPQRIAREIVSFANMNGGHIFVGVSDVGDIVGIQDQDGQGWLMDTVISRYVHPVILPAYNEVRVEDKKIAVITVPMGVAKPYAVHHDGRHDVYVRMGNTCQLAKREQIQRLFEAGGMLSVEKLPVHGSSIDDLDERRLRQYFLGVLEYDEHTWDTDKHALLLTHSFLNHPEGTRSPFCSYFACALFAHAPRRRVPQAGIRLMVFDSDDMEYDAKMDEILDTPFVGLRKEQGNGTVGYSEPSLPDLAMRYLQPHISRDVVEAERSMQRKRRWDYPPQAVRELIINAFSHRDWTRQNDVWVVVYADRLEVTSPGTLPNGMTIEKARGGERTPRNTKISDILRDCGFIEGRGMGIRHKVIPLTVEATGHEPLFEATEDHFKVTLPKSKCGPETSSSVHP